MHTQTFFFNILFHCALSQNMETSSLTYTVGSCCLAFHFIYGFLCCAKACEFDQVPFLLSWKTDLRKLMSENALPLFSSRSLMVSYLIFRPLIHVEFTFVYGVRVCSNFNRFICSFPAFQRHFLKTFFSPFYIITPFVLIDQLTIGAWIYLWAVCSIPLTCMSVFVANPCCFVALQQSMKCRRVMPSAFFSFRTALTIQDLL